MFLDKAHAIPGVGEVKLFPFSDFAKDFGDDLFLRSKFGPQVAKLGKAENRRLDESRLWLAKMSNVRGKGKLTVADFSRWVISTTKGQFRAAHDSEFACVAARQGCPVNVYSGGSGLTCLLLRNEERIGKILVRTSRFERIASRGYRHYYLLVVMTDHGAEVWDREKTQKAETPKIARKAPARHLCPKDENPLILATHKKGCPSRSDLAAIKRQAVESARQQNSVLKQRAREEKRVKEERRVEFLKGLRLKAAARKSAKAKAIEKDREYIRQLRAALKFL